MRQSIILGTGGHCRVIASLLAANHEANIVGILDLATHVPNEKILNIPVIGSVCYLEDVKDQSQTDVYLAIGDNKMRRSWYYKVKEMGFSLPNLLAKSAIVDRDAHLGEANVICPFAYIGPEAVLGNNNLVNTGAILEHEVKVGSHCHIAPSSVVAGRTSIGDYTFLGAGSVIVDRIQISSQTVIGAGATVIKSIECSGGTFVGTPARLLFQIDCILNE